MPSIDGSDTVTHTSPSPDLGLRHPQDASDATGSAADDVLSPPPIISEHQVMLGTVAATAVPPSFEGQLDGENAAIEGDDAVAKGIAAQSNSGWIAKLVRRVAPSRNSRPARRHRATHLDRQFIADARMDREMYRL
jgi:hypothetical protein